jgi:single-strand DNA-binding protein
MSDRITIVGNVATHPECKRTPAGMAITTFRIASSKRRRDPVTGVWGDTATNYYTVSTYRGLADHAFRSLRKGERVLLTGRLRLTPWESGDKRGVSIDVDADAIGHDLLWGTTTYTKNERTPRVQEDAGSWRADDSDGAWAAPGVDHANAVITDPSGTDEIASSPQGHDESLQTGTAVTDAGEASDAEIRERVDVETPF